MRFFILISDSESFFIQGPVGQLEAKAAEGKNRPTRAKVSVVICHPHPVYGGTMENKVVTTLFRAFRELGAYVVRFNYRGVGQSDGQYSAGIGETDDLKAICAWIKKERPTDELWLAGFSFGSYIVARAANEVNSAQLLTIAPAVEHFDFDNIEYPKCPWFIIQGTVDEIVPPELVFAWVDKQQNPPHLLRYIDTGHFFHGRLTDLKETLINYYQPLIS